MLQQNVQMGNFINQVKTIILSMVVKRSKAARLFETSVDMTKAADKYINVIDYGDLWDSYIKFDSDVLLAAGLEPNLIGWYIEDKERIPREMRKKVMALQKASIIDNYEEQNDYYRMLNGQPPFGETPSEWVYCPENEYDIPTDVPLHKMSNEDISSMRSLGLLEQVQAKNPNKGYLNFLGTQRISIYDARTANNYDILYINSIQVESVILNDFRLFYDKARTYYMVAVYNSEYATSFAWYDEFIGFCILVMAVQRLISNIYKQGLTRDFYDAELIKYLFKSYSIPYIEDLDLSYQRALAKNLNYLLQYKATDKVLYDVSYLLGFFDINIYKYYLVKRHKLDTHNQPIFKYVTDPDTGEVRLDYPQMFDFHFQRINLKEKDMNSAITDDRNSMNYHSIIAEDPYWINDDALMEKIYTTNYNHLVTKYMSLDVSIKVVEMMYEVCHTIRMMIDDQKDFKKINVLIPKIASHELNLFDLVIFLSAMGASKFGLDGKVPLEPRRIASVYGFNFKKDLSRLRESIFNTTDLEFGDYICVTGGEHYEYYQHIGSGKFREVTDIYTATTIPIDDLVIDRLYHVRGDDMIIKWTADGWKDFAEITEVETLAYHHVDPTLTKYILNMRATNVQEVDYMYTNIREFRKLITEYLYTTKDKETYYEYRKLYRSLLTVIDTSELYQAGVTSIINTSTGEQVPDDGEYGDERPIPAENHLIPNTEDKARIAGIIGSGDVEEVQVWNNTMDGKVVLTARDEISIVNSNLTDGCLKITTDDTNTTWTFSNLLEKINPELYTLWKKIKDREQSLDYYIDAIFVKFASLSDYKYLQNANRADTIFEFVMKLIRFFKSYTVDFVNSGVQFFFSDHYLTALKLLDVVELAYAQIDLKDPMYQHNRWYKDWIDSVLATLQITSKINFHETYRFIAWMRLYDYFHLYFRDLLRINAVMIPKDRLVLRDLLDSLRNTMEIRDYSGERWHWKDTFERNLLEIDLPLYSHINFRDLIFMIDKLNEIRDKYMMTDHIQAEETMHMKEHDTERIHFHDQFIMNIYMDNFKLYDWMRLEDSLRNMDKQMQLKDSTMLTDYISAKESMKMAEHSSERVKFRDRMYMEIEEDDKIFKDHFHQIRDLLKQIDAQFVVKEQEMLTDDPTVTNATLTIHDRKDEKPVFKDTLRIYEEE